MLNRIAVQLIINDATYINTKFAFSFAIPIIAVEPELKCRKSDSMPSENIKPLFGIKDCMINFDPSVIIPAVVSI